METRADWINETGGYDIGGTKYNIEIDSFDDQKDPKRAIAGMEQMAQAGIHYVVGPNVDDGAAAVRPVAEQNNIMYFPYAFPKELYTAPASNAVLGMVANYQSGPAIYKYLMENNGVKKIAFIAANESDPLSQRDSGSVPAGTRNIGVTPGRGIPPLVQRKHGQESVVRSEHGGGGPMRGGPGVAPMHADGIPVPPEIQPGQAHPNLSRSLASIGT